MLSVDDLAPLPHLADPTRDLWKRRAHWIQLAFDLAAHRSSPRRIETFLADLRAGRPSSLPRASVVLVELFEAPQPVQARFRTFLEALADDRAPKTLADHDAHLRALGHAFAVLPDLSDDDAEAIVDFGVLDFAFERLRTFHADLPNQLSLLPADVLERYAVDQRTAKPGTIELGALLRFWLDEHVPRLRARAAAFLRRPVAPTVDTLRRRRQVRHAQIEAELRLTAYDPAPVGGWRVPRFRNSLAAV